MPPQQCSAAGVNDFSSAIFPGFCLLVDRNMTAAGVPGDDAAQTAHEDAGLYWLGMLADSDSSVFHRWSSSFPRGVSDGKQSVMPARDHLLFLGLPRKLVQCVFALLSVRRRSAVGLSSREALAYAGYSRVHVRNSKKKPELINNLGISPWAAALTISSHAVLPVVQAATLQLKRQTPTQKTLSSDGGSDPIDSIETDCTVAPTPRLQRRRVELRQQYYGETPAGR